ncbi:putative TRAP-type transport system, small permease component, N-acetylneuraminate transporter [Vibrio nigripulchritudo SFn27]|uniref:TRAP transporter small permease protein n=1 Tax=Vibrio nigripulchritudo TaxID=28173 RepID=U4KE22_9VIBR|nr:TRAP transporter small permease [Vibrio nigripulchritudo]CCN82299.1 putative TRAP-type transport system, small permease component, N-acetylneuraminate transporter [Vibrio nigripulchritudo BLFn1]CCN88485.1 putative TRAP-type transport system, small permease component, N-acetylneuraminate transporter [Vibrio nigripulchritudo SFn27]CCN95892.1 putative TRAP-type transport system, small permease component, N-acetylneuraminate transporter [Vibrio nigripulchritudo ENn2]CCO39219.1 putative TRAP-type
MLRKITRNIEEIITVPLMLVLLVVLSWQIGTRWLLDDPSLWSEELARVLFMYMALIGCAIAIKNSSHVNITFFSDKLPLKARLILVLSLELAVLVSIFAIIYLGYQHVQRTAFFELITLEISSKWMNYSLPLGGVFMVVRQLQKMLKVFAEYRQASYEQHETGIEGS